VNFSNSLVNFTSFRNFSDSLVNGSDCCCYLMWLQEMCYSLPRERDGVLGLEQGMSLSSSKVIYEILHYKYLYHVV
jgi:hypothetical protein